MVPHPLSIRKRENTDVSATGVEALCLLNGYYNCKGKILPVKSVYTPQRCSPHLALPFGVHAHWRLIPNHHRRVAQDTQRKRQLKWEKETRSCSGMLLLYLQTDELSCYTFIPGNLLEPKSLIPKCRKQREKTPPQVFLLNILISKNQISSKPPSLPKIWKWFSFPFTGTWWRMKGWLPCKSNLWLTFIKHTMQKSRERAEG